MNNFYNDEKISLKTNDFLATSKNIKKSLKPFIKWAGGKGQLINQISEKYPEELGKKLTKYAEPFVGGGAVLFDIINKYNLKEIYICDTNRELINSYLYIRDSINDLVKLLNDLQKEYLSFNEEKRKLYYYVKREKYNNIKINSFNSLECAALFIFLNKTCFNGLYRVNNKNCFNVPIGSYKNPTICDENNLKNISAKLQNIIISCNDYKKAIDFIDTETFVYFDPPYRPLSKTASFTSYTENIFDDSAQKELAHFINCISLKGAKILLSNSDPKNTNINDDFFDILYSEYNINRVAATRMINCKSKLRGNINELLITNY